MNRKFKFASALSILLLAFTPKRCWSENEFVDVTFPTIGKFGVEAHSSLYEPGSYPFLVFKKGNVSVKQFNFVFGKEYSREVLKEFRFPARVKVVSLRGIVSPLVIGVVGVPAVLTLASRL